MKQSYQAIFIPWRFYLLLGLVFLITAGLGLRILDLAIFKRHFLQTQGDARVMRIINEPILRGIITDRYGYPLAISTSVYSVWVNPQEFIIHPKNLQALTDVVGIKSATLQKMIQRAHAKNRQFLYLKRELSPATARKIKTLLLPGVYLRQEYKRYYPEGEVAAHVLGFTNIDDQGQEGLELAYNQWLIGAPGKKRVIKDRLGRVISNVENIQERKPGNNLVLSIDHRLQYLAYRELLAGVQQNKADSGSAVILDAQTGEILAMVNQPAFNPNNYTGHSSDHFRNRVVTDVFEPGSTIKAFSIATALDSHQYKPKSVIDTYPGWMRVERHVVRDEHNNGLLSVSQILQLSSNVGVTKMILSLPPDRLWDLLHRVGFGETTGVEYPGERAGALLPRDRWSPFAVATLAFGYGISVTLLQLAQAYSVLANEGVKLPLTLLRADKRPVGKRVLDAKIANEMLQLLESVVIAKNATGELARIPGYRVAGKTGTAVIAGPGGYQKHHYVASFVGIAPVSHPRFIVAVVIRDPRGKNYYGGLVSAPVFKKIMEGSLRMLNVPPDDHLS